MARKGQNGLQATKKRTDVKAHHVLQTCFLTAFTGLEHLALRPPKRCTLALPLL
jgi:hypothetical protein